MMENSGAASAGIGAWVRPFFAKLDAAGIRWAVLRGADRLPEETRYDIDLLIERGRAAEGELLLREAAEQAGWGVRRIIDKWEYRCCLVIGTGGDPRFVPVDFFSRCLHRFHPIADEDHALRHRRRNEQGVWVVPEGFGAALSLLKELTRHDSFKENSRDEARRGAHDDAASFRAAVEGVLGAELAAKLQTACAAGQWPQVEALAPALRQAVNRGWWKRLPQAANFIARNVRHNLRPPMSCLLVLLGPDGAGKSTVGDRVAGRLYQKPYKICRRFEYNFRILPELKNFKRALAGLVGRTTRTQAPPPPGTPGSGMNKDHSAWRGMLYVTYYSLDLLAGRLRTRQLRGQGAILIFARYFHDYYYQRGYGKVPRWYLRILERLAPRPDLIVYLDRDAEEIFAGKPELDPGEIRRQQDIIKGLVAGRRRAVTVDASRGVEDTVDQVCRLAREHFLQDEGGARHGLP